MKNKIVELLPALLLAAFGGFAGTLANRREGEHLTMKKLITELVIAVFSGLLTYYLLQEYGVSENLRTAAVALAGYSARGVLAIVNAIWLHELKRFKLWIAPAAAALAIFSAGCQELTHRSYYEPDETTIVEVNGRKYGAVQEETVKTGVPDWSDGKQLNVSGVGK